MPNRVSPQARALQARAHEIIPGGCHTYAKGDDQYPETAPPLIERGAGCHVWDSDGNKYIEYGMGLRAVTLGHGHADVARAAHEATLRGVNFNRLGTLELSAAERILEFLGTGDMVKFAKNGSDVTTAAVKLARAHTRRDLILACKDHPFFSTDDWFIGSTSMAAGIPAAVRELTLRFPYGDVAALRGILEANAGRVACLIMEAETTVPPAPGYLGSVQALCREHGVVFILDEMITGFRWHNRGAQHVYAVRPDLSTFGKAMANGFPIAALVGRREIMELGGLRHEDERVFLLSTTHGAEHGSLAAAMETIRIHETEPVIGVLRRQGERLRTGVLEAAARHGLGNHIEVAGHPSNLVHVTRDAAGQPSQAFRALFMQELIRRGILAPSFVVSYAHADVDIDHTIEAADAAFAVYRKALNDGPERYLDGRPVKPVFRSRN